MRSKALSVTAVSMLVSAVLYWHYVVPRLDEWIEPDKNTALKAAFVTFTGQRYDRGESNLVVYLSSSSVSFDELVSALPKRPPGIEFRPRAAFQITPGGSMADRYFDRATGRRVHFVSVSLGSVTLATARVSILWAAGPLGVEGWSFLLLRRPAGWIVLRTQGQGIA